MEQLALHGGTPVRSKMLQYGQQWIDEEDIDGVVHVLRGDYLTQGPAIETFERKVAEISGAAYAVAYCNGTAALHGAMFAAGIGPGDEVVTTPLTFAATSNSVLYQGGTPVFADVDPVTYLLDLDEVRSKMTSKTKAVIGVDFAGQPVDMQLFQRFARQNGVLFIQDAAHSLGGAFAGQAVGSVADMTMFSFHPVKPVTTGEGGVIVTNSSEYYEKLLLFRSHGITRNRQSYQYEDQGPWYYEMQHLGYNYRLTDLQAALGSSQLAKLDSFISRRGYLAKRYNEELLHLEQEGYIRTPKQHINAKSGWHLYVIQLALDKLQADRREVYEALRAENIGVNVHYNPVHLQPYYQNIGFHKGLCPIAERLYDSFITLPLFPKMSEGDLQDVIRALHKVIAFFGKKD